MEEKGFFSISEDLIPNGTEVYVFHGSSNNNIEGFEDGAYIKGTIVGHRVSENLSTDYYRDSAWCEFIYSIVGENGKTYEATYGSALIGSFFIRTQKDFLRYLVTAIKDNLIKATELNKQNKILSETLKTVMTDEMSVGGIKPSSAYDKDFMTIAEAMSNMKYDANLTGEEISEYGDSGKSGETPKGLM